MPPNGSKELQPGTKINRLTILKLDHIDKRWRRWYLCRCDCGVEKVIQGSSITSGNTKSCGCLGTEIRRTRRVSKNHSEVTATILGYKRHAKTRGIKFELTREEVIDIIFKKCYYCGCEPSNLKVTKNSIDGGLYYNGLDRVDSHKNYTVDNVVPCCHQCNRAKNNMSKKDFLNWIKSVYEYQAMADQWGGSANAFVQTKLPIGDANQHEDDEECG